MSRAGLETPCRRLRSTTVSTVFTSPGAPATTPSSAAPSAATMSESVISSRRELGDVVVEPIGERRVHVGDGAVGLGREEPGRRVVEIVDRVLQVLEEGFVAVAFAA